MATRTLAEGYPEIAAQWDYEKNSEMTPADVSCNSNRKIWWKCEKGHEWQVQVRYRTMRLTGCPVCAGKKVWAGFNDLETKAPLVAARWHPTKNGTLTPQQVTAYTHKKVWWKCEKGHEWQAIIKSQTDGGGCPVCARKKVLAKENDLATECPTLAAQWHPEKNGTLTPEMVTRGSGKRVWWRCEKGHEWQAVIHSRANKETGCPICAGRQVQVGENDFASKHPELAAQWHPTKNGTSTPQQFTSSSNRKIWWMCEKGHEWQAIIAHRTMHNSDCPYCTNKKVLAGFNDLATTMPELAKQWHPTLNGGLTPQMVTAGSHKKVWWICGDGHVWMAVIASRSGKQKCGCPVCAGRFRAKGRKMWMSTEDYLKRNISKNR